MAMICNIIQSPSYSASSINNCVGERPYVKASAWARAQHKKGKETKVATTKQFTTTGRENCIEQLAKS
jgi:hypothetical protein